MDISTIITMIFVLGIVWGGVIIIITRALKYEKEKVKIGEK